MSNKYLCPINDFFCPYCSLEGECTMPAHGYNPEEECEVAMEYAEEEEEE